jgi:hypothetical protein
MGRWQSETLRPVPHQSASFGCCKVTVRAERCSSNNPFSATFCDTRRCWLPTSSMNHCHRWRPCFHYADGVRVADVHKMRVRLTRKLAERIDGVDLSGHQVRDVLDIPRREARLLLAERWAVAERKVALRGEHPRQFMSRGSSTEAQKVGPSASAKGPQSDSTSAEVRPVAAASPRRTRKRAASPRH